MDRHHWPVNSTLRSSYYPVTCFKISCPQTWLWPTLVRLLKHLYVFYYCNVFVLYLVCLTFLSVKGDKVNIIILTHLYNPAKKNKQDNCPCDLPEVCFIGSLINRELKTKYCRASSSKREQLRSLDLFHTATSDLHRLWEDRASSIFYLNPSSVQTEQLWRPWVWTDRPAALYETLSTDAWHLSPLSLK